MDWVKFINSFFVFINMKKRGIITEYLPWLLIGLAVLAILMITIFILKEQGTSLIDKIKDLFKFR